MVRLISTRFLGETTGESFYDRTADGPVFVQDEAAVPPVIKSQPVAPTPRQQPLPVRVGKSCIKKGLR